MIQLMDQSPNLPDSAEKFIQRWDGVTASELATAQSFVIDLCELLGVDKPHATAEQDYMFERPLKEAHGDGSQSDRRVDCYKRSHFILEAKKLKQGNHTKGYDDALLRAHAQAQNYARALPAEEGRPPFIMVVDVGNVIQLFSEFSRSGGNYIPFPDPRSHQIKLHDLRDEKVRKRLRQIWTEPMALDPSRANAQVTREVATVLASVAKSLEADGHPPHHVGAFLTRCLFSMFAEDVGLLPANGDGKGAFSELLQRHRDNPPTLQRMLQALWADMDRGGFSAALAKDVLKFNGKLFKASQADGYALPLSRAQIDSLLSAANASWTEVEPAIFGTLLERALDPTERHALGAHYTPRAYVDRLVIPTVMEPLRAEWSNAQAAALLLANEANALEGKKREDKLTEARAEVRQFHHRLCTVRVLDPACGSGNFLYVTLEHLKRLEGEVLNLLDALGDSQGKLGLEGETVTLQQLRGIELNTRAAALAELVLWIGYLQWQARTVGVANIAEPVVHDYGNIENRDAVLAYDSTEPQKDENGHIVTRWDGKTFKPHPVTGLNVPDESAQVVQERYIHPRKAQWPKVDFIVGNPPYIGARTIRQALGDGYLGALRSVHPDVPDNADLVMYWWDKAAELVTAKSIQSFGLITTNSLRQTFNRAVLEKWVGNEMAITYAVPDHPWVDSANGAAVRVALTVARAGNQTGRLQQVISEKSLEDGEVGIEVNETHGMITPGLTIGIDVAASPILHANQGMSCVGYQLTGKGFRVDADQAQKLDPTFGQSGALIRPLLTGTDITKKKSSSFAIDLFGLSEVQTRETYPAIYQWLIDNVKPERDQNSRMSLRNRWWIFGEARSTFRPALSNIQRAIATSLTAKHRTFIFVQPNDICDSTTVMFALPDGLHMGVLSSSPHVLWSMAAGGRLGVGNDSRYNKSKCFEAFPFPAEDTGLTPELTERIRTLAEQLDAHRKQQQSAHPDITLTGMYNVLDKLRNGEALSAKDKTIHEQGLVSVLRTLHDELDAAVLAAYGWSDLGSAPCGPDEASTAARAAWTDALLQRLVDLNTRRAAEEATGTIRWLRPEFQNPAAPVQAPQAAQTTMDLGTSLDTDQADASEDAADGNTTTPSSAKPATQTAWPSTLPEQIKAVADVLSATPAALDLDAIATHFKGKGRWRERLPMILETLVAIGRVQLIDRNKWRN
jgi:hypothetical protein